MAMLLILLMTATVINADVCPGGKARCSGSMSCCPLSSGSGDFGCCPFSEANCCKDEGHCCPSGLVCDLTHQGCRINGTDILLDWSVPLQAEVLEPLEQPLNIKHEREFMDSKDIPFTRIIQHEHDGTKVAYEKYTKENSEKIELTAKGEHVSETGVAESLGSRVNGICPDFSFCPFWYTCCHKSLENGHYWCCKYSFATCCDDHRTCCPSGKLCDGKGGCLNGNTEHWIMALLGPRALVSREMNDEAILQEMIQNEYDAKYDALYKEDPIEYSEKKEVLAKEQEHVSEADLAESPGSQVNSICLGGSGVCPLSSTCCRNQQGNWECCHHVGATCCDDGLHCCPNGYKCGSSSCVKDKTVPWGMPFEYGRSHAKKHYNPKVILLH